MPKTVLVWLRRDLRLTDNPAIDLAPGRGECPIPVYIQAPQEENPWSPGAASRWWLHHSLASLDQGLRALGSGLVLARGDSLAVLRRLAQAAGAEAVYWGRLYDPALRARDTQIKQALRAEGLRCESLKSRPPGIGFFQPSNRLNRRPNRRLLDKFSAPKEYDYWTIVLAVD